YGGGAPAYGGGGAPAYGGAPGRGALLEVVSSETLREPVRIEGEVTLGRKPEAGVQATGDRYMSGRHARFTARGGRVTVTDLDSKNRTFVNEQPLPPHQERALNVGDTVRMGNTVLRLASAG
ncbi:MAG TPA: FHA domain-containing protein, partial [Longimicrobium sp.]|nr:FHA domain-containing protein [Longimicrobium sp.]